LALTTEKGLRVFEIRILRGTFGLKRDEMTGSCIKLQRT
jgi:hypothetical protein